MQRTRPFMQLVIVPALIVGVCVSACSASEESSTAGTTGGVGIAASGGFGGATAAGETSNTGGATVGKGGSVASSGATFGRGGATSSGGAGIGLGGRASVPTWNQLWTNYFQPRCASCHASSSTVGSTRVFNNAAQLCTFLRNDGQLNGTATPALISASQSVLTWFSTNGSMPEGNSTVPANAVNDIRAWAAAGAVCP